jgi:hypothetical protein
MSRETDMDETINSRLFDCFGQATKEAFPGFVCWVAVNFGMKLLEFNQLSYC